MRDIGFIEIVEQVQKLNFNSFFSFRGLFISHYRINIMPFYVYMVQCSDVRSSLYTGYTKDLNRRLKEHNKGSTKSLRGKTPVRLVYKEIYRSIKSAMRREREIKKLNRKQKLELIKKHK